MALWGDVLAVGAPNVDKVEFGSIIPEAGAVKIYTRNAQAGWTHAQTLFSPFPAAQNHFGSAVTLRDGFLVVGEPDSGAAGLRKGRAVAFLDTGSSSVSFTYQDLQSGEQTEQHAGASVAIERYSSNAPYVVLSGAPGGQGNTSQSMYGGVYASAWNVAGGQATLMGTKFVDPLQVGAPTEVYERFGASVAIAPQRCFPESACANSYFVAVGYPGFHTSQGGAAVLAFHADQDVGGWGFELQRAAWDETPQNGESFGTSVDLDAGDGLLVPPRLVVGSPFAVHASPIIQTTGAVRVFERSLDGPEWTPGTEVYGPIDQSQPSQFGRAVRIRGDRVWVGAPFHDVATSSGVGEGAVFQLFRLTNNAWIRADELEMLPPIASAFLGFSLAYDSRHLVAGAVGHGGFNTWIDCGDSDTLFCSSFEY